MSCVNSHAERKQVCIFPQQGKGEPHVKTLLVLRFQSLAGVWHEGEAAITPSLVGPASGPGQTHPLSLGCAEGSVRHKH